MELRSMSEADLRCLLGHRSANFGDSMPNVDHCSLPSRIKKTPSICGNNPAAFPADSYGVIFFKISRKDAGAARHGGLLRNCNRENTGDKPVMMERTISVVVLRWRRFWRANNLAGSNTKIVAMERH